MRQQGRFEDLCAEERHRYLVTCGAMLEWVRTCAVPIIISPPWQENGKVRGGTGFVFRHPSGSHHLTTAHHVLTDGYEARGSESVHWLVGGLPPFNPYSRFHSIDRERDIVRWPLSSNEATKACHPWSRIIIPGSEWPPSPPQVGQPLLMAGFPGKLREIHTDGRIRAGG